MIMSVQTRFITHQRTTPSLERCIANFKQAIEHVGDKAHVTVDEQLKILDELAQFEFGRFLIQHRGINGYWTHYMLTYPWRDKEGGKALSALEYFLLNNAPIILATQQRFAIFLQQNQTKVQSGAALACIPCGLLGELLYLNFKGTDNIRLIGMDFDEQSLVSARQLANKRHLSSFVECVCMDAWSMNQQETFDLISSNGLNIYEPNEDKVIDLYRRFYKALKKSGMLVTSFLTPPSYATMDCEWVMNEVNLDDLRLQRIIFSDVLQATFQCYRTSLQTQNQLETAGFKSIQFIYDKARMFPTVVAIK